MGQEFETIPQQIATSIIQLMKERKIHNGDRLFEQQFMKMFSVSQTVIREALFILETKDLVVKNPRKGVYLSLPTDQDIEKLFETREVIEVFVSKAAARLLNEEQIEQIREIMEEAERKLSNHEFSQYYVYGGSFHSKLYEFTGYTKLRKLYDNIQDLFDIYYVNKTDDATQYQENVRELNDHRNIFNAIKDRDEVRCESLVHIHISHVRQRLEGEVH